VGDPRRDGWMATHHREVEPFDPTMPPDPHRLPARSEWFSPHAERHLLDRPRFCPMCGASLDRGLTSEWWVAEERVFLTWCAACHWTGNVVLFDRAIIEEPEH
jgi:hypothetical protein